MRLGRNDPLIGGKSLSPTDEVGNAIDTDVPTHVGGTGPAVRLRQAIARRWDVVIILSLALALWLPRLSGPIDLRWDAGVYYLLGTSLSEGYGYRIPSEPGSPEAVQYPPLLPAFVALHQRVLGTTEPALVGPWLRWSYAVMSLVFALAVLCLARKYLPPALAVAATALCLLHHLTVFLSDLLFTELPFALLSVCLVLVSSGDPNRSRPWLREAGAFALAAAGFLLRTAGVALLAAWVLEALLRRRWVLALSRAVLAVIPVMLWQMHVSRVAESAEYRHPAYDYQRASYQFYNVSYAENVSLVDPFRPELGRVNAGSLVARAARNLAVLPRALGEAVSAKADGSPLERVQARLFGRRVSPQMDEPATAERQIDPLSSERPVGGMALVLLYVLSALTIIGVVILVRRGAWLMVLIVLGSVALICTTPWPLQFTRYLAPLIPFLTICVVLAASQIRNSLRRLGFNRTANLARVGVAALLVLTFTIQIFKAARLFYLRASKEAVFVAPGLGSQSRFFAHDASWQSWENAVVWMHAQTPATAIVATSAPHLYFLLTQQRAVLPPMESDPERERRLLGAVPVSYVIVDKLTALDVSRRYARPALQSDEAGWPVVYSIAGTTVHERASGRQ